MLEVVVTVDMEEVVGEVMAVVVMVDMEVEVMEVALEVMVVVVMADMAEEVMEVDLMAEVVALMVGDMVEAMEEEDMVVVGGMEEALEVAQPLWSSKCPMNGPLRTDYYQRLLYSGGPHVPVTLVLVRKDK